MVKAFYISFSNYSQSIEKFFLKKNPQFCPVEQTTIITPKWELQTGRREHRGSTLMETPRFSRDLSSYQDTV